MKRRFFALRIISMIYKILAVLAFIAMIGAIVYRPDRRRRLSDHASPNSR